jgi:hypothetical protein
MSDELLKSTPPESRSEGHPVPIPGDELETAIRIALAAHAGQREKNGDPYILHPLRVMGRLQTEPERITAVLHEVLDTPGWNVARLRESGICDMVLGSLDYLRKHDGDDFNTFIHRAVRHPIAHRVRLADLEDDMDVRRLPDITEEDRKRLVVLLEVYQGMVVPVSDGSVMRSPMWFKSMDKAMKAVTAREVLPCPMDWPVD